MIDGHVHLEKGPLTLEYILEFVQAAKEKGITKLQILDHSHRFKEFEPMYEPLKSRVPEQKAWLENKEKKFRDSLDDYIALIEKAKATEMPIEVSFGLEVCYTTQSEAFLRELLPKYHFDFLVGAVHSVAGVCYDMPYSEEYLWKQFETDEIYAMYLESVRRCAMSGLFTQLAHPDTIKLFNYYPSAFPVDAWRKIAYEAKRFGMKVECNTGLKYRYGHEDIGLSDRLLELFTEEGVELITASDAHKPEDVGRYIAEACERIEAAKNKMKPATTCYCCGYQFTGKFCPECGSPAKKPEQNAYVMPAESTLNSMTPGFQFTPMQPVPATGMLDPAAAFAPAPEPEFEPSDEGLTILVDACRKTLATVGGDGYTEEVLYLDEKTGQYSVHQYIDYQYMARPTHRGYRVTKDFADGVLRTVEEQKLAGFVGAQGLPMCGGDMVVKFWADGKFVRVSMANLMGDPSPLYAVQNALCKALKEENKITE